MFLNLLKYASAHNPEKFEHDFFLFICYIRADKKLQKMPALQVITAPDPILKQPSELVSEVTNELREFMRDMVDTMDADGGVGLAAIQVGLAKQILVIDLKDDDDDAKNRAEDFFPLFIINPIVTWSSEEYIIASEGCLSVPSLVVEVPRPSAIKLQYLNYDGVPSTLEAKGWLARVIQHEIDHLHGRLIIDYLSSLKKDLAITKLKKIKKHLI